MNVVQIVDWKSVRLMEGTEVIERLDERIVGRHTKKTIYHPETGEVLIGRNELITEDIARIITN